MNTYIETPRLSYVIGKKKTSPSLASLEYAKTVLKLKELYSFTSLPNKRSERVMQKIGMTKIKEFNHPLVSTDHHYSGMCCTK